jgi:thioredoxin reductase (NADPH)
MQPDSPPLDALIIGGGPAGLVAAVYLQRFLRRFVLFDEGQARAARIPRSHNVPGFPGGIPGPELLDRLRQQVAELGARVSPWRVEALHRVSAAGEALFVAHAGGSRWLARRVLLATGAVDREPALPGIGALRQLQRLRQCPICDGHEFAGQRLLVVGNGPHGVREACFIRHFSPHTAFVALDGAGALPPHLQRELAERGVALLDAPPVAVQVDGGGPLLHLHDGRTHRFDTMYAALGCHPRNELGRQLGARVDARGNLVIDAHRQTVVPGLYAAGDVTGGLDQIAVAAGEAAIAATAIHNSL